jgi:flagellar biosynthesis GTPase FlhF
MSPMSIRTIPRHAVRLSLAVVRLPVAVAEQVTERTGIDISRLPPIAAYDAVEAQAKMMIGRWLDDRDLVLEGEQQESARRHRDAASDLSRRAEEIRDDAEQEMGRRVTRAERSRQQVRARTEERKEEIRRQEEEAKREAEAKARKREEAVRQAAKVQEKVTEAKERQAELARIRAESESLRKESEALQAERVVTAIDEHLDAKKSLGRNGGSVPLR